MAHPLFPITLSLFLLMDPIGNIPVYISVLKEISPKRSLWIVFREMCIALVLILLFALGGGKFLTILDISNASIYFSGGIVLFMIAVKMIFPGDGGISKSLTLEGDPFIFPLAIPLVAGPSILAAVVIYSKQLESMGTLFAAIVIAWIFSMAILLSSPILSKWLGTKGISAMERLMGFILMLISINMFLSGVEMYHATQLLKH